MTGPGLDSQALAAALLAGVAAAAGAGLAVKPTRRLATRIRPYTVATRISLHRSADVLAVAAPSAALSGSTLRRLFGPPLERLVLRAGRLVDRTSDERLALLLRQAGLFADLLAQQRVRAYRMRQLGSATGCAAAGLALSLALGQPPAVALTVVALGFVAGAARARGGIDRAISERRAKMRIELYTVNQWLAMKLRVGGGPVQALRSIVGRAHGAVIDELAEALRLHASGLRPADALEHLAAVTPEPHAARTYRTLASSAEYGSDALAKALLRLSEDVRDDRREDLRRAATKRRAAMLLPIIGLMAPTMILFMAAPLPSIVFGS